MKGNIFIDKNVMAISIAIVIALVGYISLNTLPVEQYPNIAPPTVEVSTSYSGADANTCMKSVIQPLEEQINGVQDMTYMTATASSTGLFQARCRPRYGYRQRAEPCVTSGGALAE